VNNFEELNLIR